jgi:hypothetical protein
MGKDIKNLLWKVLCKGTSKVPVVGDLIQFIPDIIKIISDEINTIDDDDEILRVAIAEIYTATLIQGIGELSIKINNFSIEQFERDLVTYKNVLVEKLAENQKEKEFFHMDSFNIDNLTELPIIKYAETYYFDLLTNKKWLEDTKERKRLRVFIRRHMPILFHELLKKGGIRFEKFSSYLYNEAYSQHVRNYKRELYITALGSMYTRDKLFGDNNLVLSDTYIKSDFCISTNCFEKKSIRNNEEKKEFKKSVHSFIEDYFTDNPQSYGFKKEVEQYKFVLLLGMPGQGKSSFCKSFLHEISTEELVFEQEIFFACLQDMEVNDLINDFWPSLTKEINLQAKRLVKQQLSINEDFDFQEMEVRQSILLLDGLDELEMASNIKNEHALDLCRKIQKETNEGKGKSLKAIVTSREGRVQETDFKNQPMLWMEISGSTLEQQVNWLQAYKSNVPETKLSVENLRSYNQKQHLKELLEQPILLHIITQLFNDFNVSLIGHRTGLYDSLFTSVIQRKYDVEGALNVYQTLEETLELEKGGIKDVLRFALQEVAFLILKNPHGYVRKAQLVEAKEMTYLQKIITATDEEGIGSMLRAFMMSFYIRNTTKSEEDILEDEYDKTYGVEFIHKSFQEYLTAEYVWRKLKELIRKDETKPLVKTKCKSYQIEEVDDALELIASIFEVKLSKEIHDYVEILILQDDFETRKEITNRLLYFLSDFIEKDFVYKLKSGIRPTQLVKNIFYNYWMVSMQLNKNERTEFENLISKELDEKDKTYLTDLLIMCDVKLLSKQDLSEQNFFRADLRGANLKGVDLTGANLKKADLRGTNLIGSFLSRSNLKGADLREAKLSGADLESAYMNNCKFNSSQLVDLDLSRARNTGSIIKIRNA